MQYVAIYSNYILFIVSSFIIKVVCVFVCVYIFPFFVYFFKDLHLEKYLTGFYLIRGHLEKSKRGKIYKSNMNNILGRQNFLNYRKNSGDA